MRAVVAIDPPLGARLVERLAGTGAEVVAAGREEELSGLLAEAEMLFVPCLPEVLTASLVSRCDRAGVRIVPIRLRDGDERLAEAFGLTVRDADASGEELIAVAPAPVRESPERGRVIAVWGPAGAPGRSTLAVEIAGELARRRRIVALVDADTHAPSLALRCGLADEVPGFAAACRLAGRQALTVPELSRIRQPLGEVDVLTGINRPSRWPELSGSKVCEALGVCRQWAQDTVVDLAAPLERDEEIVSDLDGPRRNAATLAALAEADLVIAVAAADPVGVARFVRAHPELRAVVGATPVRVVVNRTRGGAVGIDPHGQVRRTLERFGGIDQCWFVPQDGRAADAALLAGQPVWMIAPRSALVTGVRRFVSEAVEPAARTRRAAQEEVGAPARRSRGPRRLLRMGLRPRPRIGGDLSP